MTMAAVEGENIAGALIFWAYIGAALYMSTLVVGDVIHKYKQLKSTNADGSKNEENATKQEYARFFGSLSVLSFTALSWHMLRFLALSYAIWAQREYVRLPRAWTGPNGLVDLGRGTINLQLWRWSSTSSLFQDFADMLANDSRRYWWTHMALMYSMGWNVFMAIEGTVHQVPNLWAYFVLAQFLPVSFTQNLFCTALLLRPEPSKTVFYKPASRILQIALVLLYATCVLMLPQTVGSSEQFWPLIFAMRVLLFLPYLVLRPSVAKTKVVEDQKSWRSYFVFEQLVVVICIALFVVQTINAGISMDLYKVIRGNPAVAALGWDFVNAAGSLFVFVPMRSGPAHGSGAGGAHAKSD